MSKEVLYDKLRSKTIDLCNDVGQDADQHSVLIEILIIAMELAEKAIETGPERKRWVLNSLFRLIDTLPFFRDKIMLRLLIEKVLPAFIDIIIMATKSLLNINRHDIKECAKWTCCLPCTVASRISKRCSK